MYDIYKHQQIPQLDTQQDNLDTNIFRRKLEEEEEEEEESTNPLMQPSIMAQSDTQQDILDTNILFRKLLETFFSGKKVSFLSWKDTYLTATPDTLVTEHNNIQNFHYFTIHINDDNSVSIQTMDDQYVSANPDGTITMVSHIDSWEKFQMWIHNDQCAFKTFHGT